jgi:hypothetical protein
LLFYRLTIVQILGTKVMKCIGSVFGTLQIDFPRCMGRLLAIEIEDPRLPRTITRLPHRMLQGQYHLSRICYMIFLGT